jgi:hypothetical protein
MAPPRKSELTLHRAFDTVRFGAANILNLRESLPTVADATHRAEAWVRQRQVEGAKEVLIITGRGKGSEGGVSPVREAIVRLVLSLRRRGVIDRYEEHTAGSFSIQLASVQSMVDAPRRRREPRRPPAAVAPGLAGLSPATRRLLRDLAERSLDALGVKETSKFLEAEMQRHLSAIAAALPEGSDRDARLRSALKHALDQTV